MYGICFREWRQSTFIYIKFYYVWQSYDHLKRSVILLCLIMILWRVHLSLVCSILGAADELFSNLLYLSGVQC